MNTSLTTILTPNEVCEILRIENRLYFYYRLVSLKDREGNVGKFEEQVCM